MKRITTRNRDGFIQTIAIVEQCEPTKDYFTLPVILVCLIASAVGLGKELINLIGGFIS